MVKSVRGSEHVSIGAHAQEDRSTDEVGRFLSLVRFESREKVEELVTNITLIPVESSR